MLIPGYPRLKLFKAGRGSFKSVSTFTISSRMKLLLFIIIDLPLIESIYIGEESFYATKSLSITSSYYLSIIPIRLSFSHFSSF